MKPLNKILAKLPAAMKKNNTQLNASALELLVALTQATDQLERDYVPTALDGHGALIRKLRAVIAKAEGRNK